MRRRLNVRRLRRETFVKSVVYHDVLASTNSLALELVAERRATMPMLVVTDVQTMGRGRGRNVWWAASGALTFSVALDLTREPIPVVSWPRIALAAALGVCEGLETFAHEVAFGLRWPNDVYCEGRKICGVLPELADGPCPCLVLGIGVNVNNALREAPGALPATAISLREVTGRAHNLTDVLVAVLNGVAARLHDLAIEGEGLTERWRERDLLRGRLVRVGSGEETAEGACVGIDASGALEVHTETGRRLFYGGTAVDLDEHPPSCAPTSARPSS